MEIIEAFATQNKCYKIGSTFTPSGLMLHSVGCPQPSAAVFARSFNQYQPGGASVCVHAFVQADGTVYQTLPWETRAWHCGGAANNTHIGVEMTEPGAGMAYAEAAAQITGTYRTAVTLFATLCETYGLDPLADGVIIGHTEGHRRGVASNHADPEYLWQQYGMGYTMDGFRADVAAALAAGNTDTDEEDDDMVRYNSIDDVPGWAQDTVRALMDAGALQGDDQGRLDLSLDMIRGLVVGAKYAAARNPRYETIKDVPDWAREETQKLVDRGALAGTSDGRLDLSLDMLRTLLITQEMVDAKEKEGKA